MTCSAPVSTLPQNSRDLLDAAIVVVAQLTGTRGPDAAAELARTACEHDVAVLDLAAAVLRSRTGSHPSCSPGAGRAVAASWGHLGRTAGPPATALVCAGTGS